jgi:hypothetical protein
MVITELSIVYYKSISYIFIPQYSCNYKVYVLNIWETDLGYKDRKK